MTPKPEVDFLPLPAGSKLEVAWRLEPFPVVGITLSWGSGGLTVTYTPEQAREIAASIVEAADQVEQAS